MTDYEEQPLEEGLDNEYEEGVETPEEGAETPQEEPSNETKSEDEPKEGEVEEAEVEGDAEVVEDQNQSQESVYLDMARRVQAEFENYRRRTTEEMKRVRLDGQASVIEVFLPCLDTFKEAKKSITDENILKGIEMIENKIYDALQSLGVQKINSIGEKYDPHFHNVISVMRDDEKDNGIILDEFQAGYILNDKVLRYAKVIVNKKED